MAEHFTLAEDDPARREIASRAQALGITGDPGKPAHPLGRVTLTDGRQVNAFVMHAVDPVITDGQHILVIARSKPPSVGKAALPGGMIDPIRDGAESGVIAALREAKEETGLDLTGRKATLIGTRRMNRPFDVRMAFNDYFAPSGVHKGDVFLVSTQAVRFDVPELAQLPFTAGDDAAPNSARLLTVKDMTPDSFGPPDHYDMVMEALGLAI